MLSRFFSLGDNLEIPAIAIVRRMTQAPQRSDSSVARRVGLIERKTFSQAAIRQ
jgi:hypothetical protein